MAQAEQNKQLKDELSILAILEKVNRLSGKTDSDRIVFDKKSFERDKYFPMDLTTAEKVIKSLFDEGVLTNQINEELDDVQDTWKNFKLSDEGIKYKFPLSGRFSRNETLGKETPEFCMEDDLTTKDRLLKLERENFAVRISDRGKFDSYLKNARKVYKYNRQEAKIRAKKNEFIESILFIYESKSDCKPSQMIINNNLDSPEKPGYGKYWKMLFEIAKGELIDFDEDARGCITYFNSNTNNKLYANYGYIKSPILCQKDKILKAQIPIKQTTEKDYRNR